MCVSGVNVQCATVPVPSTVAEVVVLLMGHNTHCVFIVRVPMGCSRAARGKEFTFE